MGTETSEPTTPADTKTTGKTTPSARPFIESTPTNLATWVLPKYAAIVVSVVAIALLGVLITSIVMLQSGPVTETPTANPNAATISALASAAIAALTSLAAAYFGIKVASEQSAQSAATAAAAVTYLANSTLNGNPEAKDF